VQDGTTEVSMSHGGPEGPVAVSAGDVSRSAAIDALRRILASGTFAQSRRSREFLAYVVREKLDGRGHRLKERTVARAALGKAPDFDARSDSGVRVQATRVRAQLDAYYAGEGADDDVRISLPRGSYVPVISIAPAEPGPADAAVPLPTLGPGVAVVRFTRPDDDVASTALAIGLTESLVGALSSFPGIRVVGPVDGDGSESTGPAERRLGTRWDVHYLIHGAVVSADGDVVVTVRLVDAASGEVVWADTFHRSSASLAGFTGQDDVVRRVAGVVGDYSGAVLRHATRRGGETTNPLVWAAMLEFYEGLERTTPESALRLLSSLLQAHKLEPQNPLLLSMLASTESYLANNSSDVDRAQMLDACEAHARAALLLDPTSGHAHLVLGVAAFARGNERMCLEHLRLAVELSPGNPTILYGAGWYVGMAGEWDLGVQMVRESVRLNPASPSLRYTYLAVDDLMSGDYAAALIDAMRYSHTDDFWQPVLLALALDGLGYRDEAVVEVAKASALVPDLQREVRESGEFPGPCVQFLASRLEELLARTAGPA
jgi:TolB-like protein/tetratricopeptide (TPR) repeat protein